MRNISSEISPRVDSCRKCGEDLQVMKLCGNCEQLLHVECSSCNAFVDDPVHLHENFSSQSFLQNLGVEK